MQKPTHTIGFPVAGEWVAVNTPAERIPSHGTDFFGQRYAYDLVRLNSKGTGFSTSSILRQFTFFVHASKFCAWNEPVFAAFKGEVIAAEDGWSDRLRINAIWQVIRATFLQRAPEPSDLRPLLGNYLLIQGDAGVALYAHLRKGSILVRKGQTVEAGEHLASVGNSGNSTMPHLHFHVMDRADPWQAQGVYCDFKSAEPEAVSLVPQLMKTFLATPLAPSDAQSLTQADLPR
jgi:hypothetical protein